MRWTYVVLISWLVSVSATIAQNASVTLENVRFGLHEDRTRIVFDLSGPVTFMATAQKDPSRILLQISDASLAEKSVDILIANALVRGVHVIAAESGALQAEIGLTEDFGYKAFLLAPSPDRGNRLVVDVYPGTSADAKLVSQVESSGKGVGAIEAESHSAVPDNRTGVAHRTRQQPPARSSRNPVNIGGTWEQEWAVEADGGDSQKFEALVEPRVDIDFDDGVELTAIARIRLDAVGDLGPDMDKPDNYSYINGPWYNDAHAEFSIRELYLDTTWSDTYWRIGKQQVVWGQADGIKVLDVVNPQSFREFILDDFDMSRIPLTMVNVQMPVGNDATIQLLWIPDTTYHELAEFDTPYFLTSPLLVPVAPEGVTVNILDPDVPDNPIDDSDIGGRISGIWGGWDITVNYLYHYQDYLVLYQEAEIAPGGVFATVSPTYERNHLVGGTLSNAFGDFTVRTELAYNSDTFQISGDISNEGIVDSVEVASVIGVDWQLGGYDTLLSMQWFQSHLIDYDSSIYRDETEQNLSLYYQRNFANETWQLSSLALYSTNHQDSLIQSKLKYFWRSNLEVWLGADVFSGDRDGIYGQFRNFDRILLGFELGF